MTMHPICAMVNPIVLRKLLLNMKRIAPSGLFWLLMLQSPLWAQTPQGPSVESAPQAAIQAPPSDPSTVVAVVGQTPILWGDIQPKVDGKINSVLKQLNREFPKEELVKVRAQLSRQALRQSIMNKMMRECFLLDQVGTESAEKRREANEKMASKARQLFFEKEVQGLKEKYKTEDLTELDKKLREEGSSLLARQREFADMMLGHLYMRSKVEQDPAVTIAEINTRYVKDIDTYRQGEQARWEQLTVLFKNHPSREAAREAIIAIGQEAYFGGNLQAVAKAKSEEPFADEGGLHDWTTRGSLASTEIDEQLFTIPLNKMSEIIQDSQGFHIIRVLERKGAGVKPLAQLQDQIRKTIKQEKVLQAQTEMIEQMQRRVPVWSIYPDDVEGALPLAPTRVAARQGDIGTGERF